jgi:predicted ArsR family transcriptional regulator
VAALELLRHEAPLKPQKVALLLRKNANTVRWHLSELVKDGKVVKQASGYVLSPFST